MQELEQRSKRQVAYKVTISDISKGNLVKDDFFVYIRLGNNNISRVNLIATIVYKSEELGYASAIIDDGTGRISLRNFENSQFFSRFDIGDIVSVIGKVREFSNEKYVLPEILKKMNDIRWINVRKLELKYGLVEDETNVKIEHKEEKFNNLNEEIYLLIKRLDTGDGVFINDIIKNSNNREVDKIVNKLLESGDVFEIKPGKIKVLE